MANYRPSVTHLKRSDPVLALVIEAVGPCRIQLRTEGTHFQALTRSIVFQQLSGKAAGTILGRFNALFPRSSPTPELVLKKSDEELRAVGLSRQKIGYMRDLSQKVQSGELPLDDVEAMSDDDLITHTSYR
jgi:3-methyladenine DNA glycosylase/8-oxoguanine DNA glycosylase